MRAFQKTTSLFALLFACTSFLFTACGGDSSSSGAPEDPEDVHPAKEAGVDNKVSDSKVTKDKIYDSSVGAYLNTIQFGMYVWLEDNATEGYSGSTMCYNDDPDNCYAYGRMYHPGYARCPSGFSVPTKDDWSKTMSYISKYPEVAASFGFSMGGYCYEGLHGVACTDLDKAGYYLAGDSTIAIVKGRSVSFRKADEENFYQLRCVKYTYLVATVEDLPHCDSVTRSTLQPFYVMSEKTNYKCSGTRWVDDFSNSCSSSENGMSAVYNDTMYICKFREWQVADISDSKDACTDENDRTTYLFNGVLFACEDGEWRALKNLELKLGYCRPSMIGVLDSIETTTSASQSNYYSNEVRPYDSYAFYVCDSTGWRTARLSDYMGKCDSTTEFKEGKLHGLRYVCRKGVWDTFTKLEGEIGICSPKKQGVIDTTEDKYAYICDENSWRTATKHDYLGDCLPKVENKIRPYGGDKYICRDSAWVKLSAIEADLGLCTAGIQGKIDTTEKKAAYICDSLSWRYVKANDIGGACNASKQDKIIDVNGTKYYCDKSKWISFGSIQEEIGICTDTYKGKVDSIGEGMGKTYYLCDTIWNVVYTLDLKFGRCTGALEGTVKSLGGLEKYKCTKSDWKLVSYSDALPKCDSSQWGRVVEYSDTEYACKTTYWEKLDAFEKTNGVCSKKNQGAVIKVDGVGYICTTNGWSKTGDQVASLGECTYKDSTVYKATPGGIYYACHNYGWTPTTSIEQVFGKCNFKNEGKQVVYNNKEYVCDSVALGKGWHQLSAIDTLRGYCSNKRLGDTITYVGDHYLCKKGSSYNAWTKVGYREFMGVCTVAREGHKMFNGLNYSLCADEKWVGVTETFTDTRAPAKTYRTLKINGVTWMLDNLEYATADSSDCINGTSSCDGAGRLYGFSAAKKACPTGWSLPDTAAWNSMIRYVHSLDSAHIKSIGGSAFWNPTEDIYGLAMQYTGYEYFFLQNGQDPMTKHGGNDSQTGLVAAYWNSDGTIENWGRLSMLVGGGTGQGQDARVTKVAVRCIKE